MLRPLAFLRALMRRNSERPLPRSAVVGKWGEARAADFLAKEGYTVVGRNVRPNRRDEIDLIVKDARSLVFVEVKTRRKEDYGRPAMAVDKNKRHALNRAASAYLRKARYPHLFYRFDVVEVLGQPEDQSLPVIRHIDHAFPFETRFRFPV